MVILLKLQYQISPLVHLAISFISYTNMILQYILVSFETKLENISSYNILY